MTDKQGPMNPMNKAVERFRAKVRPRTDSDVDKAERELDALTVSMGNLYSDLNNKISTAIENAACEPVQLSWLPTATARVSIFSPIGDKDLDNRHGYIEFKSSWGSLTVYGPALNTTDESVFLALLHFIKKKQRATIKVNYREICRVLGLSYQTRNMKRIKTAIKKLALTSLDFELKDKDGTWGVERILKSAKGTKDYSTVEVDPWFFSKFLKNDITMLDLQFRQKLKGDIAKCLYRFLSSHRGIQSYRIETLIMALNMNQSREMKYHTRALKSAFTQLQKKKFLTYSFRRGVFENIKIL